MNILLIRAKPTFMDMILGIPIGLSMIAAVADRTGKHHVEILDLALERTHKEADRKLRQKLQGARWDLVGLTCMTVEYEPASEVARAVRSLAPEAKIVFGGQHPTIQTEEVASNYFCDYVVRGEGEETFLELVATLQEGGDPGKVNGIAFRTDRGQIVITPPRPPIQDLDALPFPAYHLLDVERYFELESARYTPKHRRALQIFTSRGCPWRCIYCHDLFGKKFRARSPENVFEEIKLLYDRYGVREFMVEDDIFNLDMDRAKKICDLIIESGIKIHLQFGNGLRLERFDEELVRKLAQAGTHHIAIAIESASPRIQRMIKKNLKLERTRQVLSWMRKYKINTLGFFMIGFPFETIDEINQTIKFARESDLDEALFSIVIPYSGTELNRMVRQMGLYDADEVGKGGRQMTLIKSPYFDFATLKRLQRKAYLTFFLSRLRFIRMLPKLINFNSCLKYLRAIERNFLAYGGDAYSRIN